MIGRHRVARRPSYHASYRHRADRVIHIRAPSKLPSKLPGTESAKLPGSNYKLPVYQATRLSWIHQPSGV